MSRDRLIVRSMDPKTCPVCGSSFTPDRSSAKFCSGGCCQRHHNARRVFSGEYRARKADYDAKRNDSNHEARRSRHHLRRYGVSRERYLEMLSAQGGKCAICASPEPFGRGAWHVDHDHATGAVRALLCTNCNAGLGQFKDDESRMATAISYLRSFAPEAPGAEFAFGDIG